MIRHLFELRTVFLPIIPWVGGAAIASVIWTGVLLSDSGLQGKTAEPTPTPISIVITVSPVPSLTQTGPYRTPEPTSIQSSEAPEAPATPSENETVIPVPLPTSAPTLPVTLPPLPTLLPTPEAVATPTPFPCRGPGNSDGHANGYRRHHC